MKPYMRPIGETPFRAFRAFRAVLSFDFVGKRPERCSGTHRSERSGYAGECLEVVVVLLLLITGRAKDFALGQVPGRNAGRPRLDPAKVEWRLRCRPV